jgi:hypothetical protein
MWRAYATVWKLLAPPWGTLSEPALHATFLASAAPLLPPNPELSWDCMCHFTCRGTRMRAVNEKAPARVCATQGAWVHAYLQSGLQCATRHGGGRRQMQGQPVGCLRLLMGWARMGSQGSGRAHALGRWLARTCSCNAPPAR